MAQHVRILGWLHLVLGGLGVAGAALLFGGMLLGGALSGRAAGFAGMAALGSILGVVMVAFSLPGLLAGYGLLKFRPWARMLTIVLGILELFGFPFGTILGVYTLWVLFSSEGARLFEQSMA